MSGRSLPGIRLAKVSRVTRQMYVGGDLDVLDEALAAAQLAELVEAGITDIIDVRLESDDSDWVAAQCAHLRYVHLGVEDAGQRMSDAWFDDGAGYATDMMRNPDTVVLVHCHLGVNRGPSLGFAILLALGWDPVEALKAVRDARDVAVMAYAEDAVDWWLRRIRATPAVRSEARDRIARWRRDNDLDLDEVTRHVSGEERPLS